MSLEEYQALIRMQMEETLALLPAPGPLGPPAPPSPKPKRKVSAYSREFGRQYRALRKKHPRMSHGQITKKAHAATRKIRKPRK